MKIPSYFTTLKTLLVIILLALIIFMIRQYNLDVENNAVIVEKTLHYQRSTGAAVILVLLSIILLIVIFLNKQHSAQQSNYTTQLTAVETTFKNALQSISDPFFALDAAYNILYCNDSFKKMTGNGDAVLTGKNLYEIFRQFNSPAIHKNFVEAFEAGKPLSFELYDYFYDNWKDVNINPAADMLVVHMKDATLRKKYETELKTAMQFLEETNTVGLIGAWELDIATGKVNWSNETCNIHEAPAGYSPDLKNALSFYKAGYSRDTMTHAVKHSLEHASSWDKILQIVTINGKEKWIRAIGRPQIEEGEVVKLIGTFQDVEQQKLMLDKLTETEQKFEAVFENSNKAKIILSIEEEIIDANETFLIKTGYSKENIVNRPLASIAAQQLNNTASPGTKWIEKTMLLHKDGTNLQSIISGTAIQDKNGITVYFLLNIDF